MEHEESLYGVEGSCPDHGDEAMIECRMCGAEFCATCFPGSRVCPECANEEDDPDDEDLDDDVDLIDDEEIDALIEDGEDLPDEDLVDDDADDDDDEDEDEDVFEDEDEDEDDW